MAILNNPAGRLHELLTEYREKASEQKTIWDTWAQVFDVQSDQELIPLLGQAAGLLSEIEQVVQRIDSPEITTMHTTFSRQWGLTIWSMDQHPRSTPSPGPAHVDPSALAALGVLSVLLSNHAPDGRVPDQDAINELRGDVQELLDTLAADDTLPIDVRSIILQRMHDVAWALDHVYLGGPGAVADAMERLLGQILIQSPDAETRSKPIFRKALEVAAKVYGVFLLAPATEKALESWEHIYGALPPGGH